MNDVSLSSKMTALSKFFSPFFFAPMFLAFLFGAFKSPLPCLPISVFLLLPLLFTLNLALKLKFVSFDGETFRISDGFRSAMVSKAELTSISAQAVVSPPTIRLNFKASPFKDVLLQPPGIYHRAKYREVIELLARVIQENHPDAKHAESPGSN